MICAHSRDYNKPLLNYPTCTHHLSCSHLVVLTNEASINYACPNFVVDTGFHFGWVYSRGWQRMGAVCLTFQKTDKIFPKLVVFYIPTSKGKFFTLPENKSFNKFQICRCSLPVHGLFFKSKNSLPNLKCQIYKHFLDLDLTWETVVQPRVTEILLFASKILQLSLWSFKIPFYVTPGIN